MVAALRRCRRSAVENNASIENGESETNVYRYRYRRDSRITPLPSFAALALVAAAAVSCCLPLARGGSAGSSHSCVVLTSGDVKCWGENYQGQLGLNDLVTRGLDPATMGDNLPIVPLGIFEVATVQSGVEFNCAVSATGTVKCWGKNDNGQLGLGDNETRGDSGDVGDMGDNLPTVNLGAGASVDSMGLGLEHACAVLADNSLKCWGSNEGGQLGLGDQIDRGDSAGQMGDALDAVDLGTNVTATAVALGSRHTCAIVDDGGVKCWGNNDGGQLGYGDRAARGVKTGEMGDSLELVDLGRDQKARAIAMGAFHSCALLYTGDIKCWGFGQEGQLGQGSNSSIGQAAGTMGDNLPTINVGTGRTVVAIAPGGAHTCAVLDDNTIKCWGSNLYGSLGQGDLVARGVSAGEMGDNLLAVNLTFGDGAGAVSNAWAGTYHTCVSGTEGGMACFGINAAGQLGAGQDEKNIGDEAGETGLLQAIDLGSNATILVPDAPGAGVTLLTLSPTAAPTPVPAPTPMPTLAPVIETRAPVADNTTDPERPGKPLPPSTPSPSPLKTEPAVEGPASDGGNSAGTTAAIASAAVCVPLVAIVALCCCWRRRKQQQRVMKGATSCGPVIVGAAGSVGGGGDRNGGGRDTAEHSLETNGNGGASALPRPPPPYQDKAHPASALAAMPAAAPLAGGSMPLGSASVETVDSSSEGLPRPSATAALASTSVSAAPASAAAAAGAATATPVAVAVAAASASASGVEQSDDDDSSWGPSDQENPAELRRTGSNSSISTLDSTSTASSTWPSAGFVTPARTEISRGSSGSGRYGVAGGGRSKGPPGTGGSAFGVAGVGGGAGLDGTRTPASMASATPGRMEPNTPSPRSASGSSHGTPHPPEMRLAQFARGSSAMTDTGLYGLPEMEIGRSSSTAFEGTPAGGGGNPGWPVGGTRGTAPLTASTVAAAAAASAVGGGGGGGVAVDSSADANGDHSPDETSPTMGPTLTPARVRHRAAEAAAREALLSANHGMSITVGGGPDAARRASRRKSNRSSGTSAAASPIGDLMDGGDPGGVFSSGGLGMGAEEAAAAFAEEEELEALQIDKNDLKLVFGRPFARGKSSEVYQVTHAGKNRAAKIIDLFSLGVVGEEVTRLYASFAQELRAMKGIRHDCVAAVYGAVATPSELTIVTDLVKRGPLRAVLDDKSKRESLKAPTRHRIIKDVAAGMAYLSEQGVQHRNLHSHNVLITKEWGAKVADYGLAHTTEVMLGAHDRAHSKSKKRTRSPYRAGTLRWTAPELLRPSGDGTDPFTEASDVYSLGVIAWEVLCGSSKLPYDGVADDKVKSMILEGSTPPISMETPIAYSKLMLLCWRRNPKSRPSFSNIGAVLLKDPPPVAQS